MIFVFAHASCPRFQPQSDSKLDRRGHRLSKPKTTAPASEAGPHSPRALSRCKILVKKNRQKKHGTSGPVAKLERTISWCSQRHSKSFHRVNRVRTPRDRTHSEPQPPRPTHQHSLGERSKTTCRATPFYLRAATLPFCSLTPDIGSDNRTTPPRAQPLVPAAAKPTFEGPGARRAPAVRDGLHTGQPADGYGRMLVTAAWAFVRSMIRRATLTSTSSDSKRSKFGFFPFSNASTTASAIITRRTWGTPMALAS